MNDMQTSQAFWLTLANAFMPPQRLEILVAFRDDLAADLAELCADLGLDAGNDLAVLRANIAAIPDQQALLVDYSHLFLQTPIPATLNLARYVDGSLNGPCLDALENAYRAAGIAKRDALRDLSDHAAMQMETLAVLLGELVPALTPAEFANICLVGALPRLAAAIAAESPASPYAPLARIAARAIEAFAAEPDKQTEHRRRRAEGRTDTDIGVWRHCAACGKSFVREKEIAIMAKALAQAGLPADHLTHCPDCRDATQGFFKRAIK